MRRLWTEEWSTQAVFVPSSTQEEQFTTRGFYGAYEVTVTYSGEQVKTVGFHLSKGQDAVVDIVI